MLSSADAQKISDLFYAIDTHVRNDLFHNRIADERDYVSRLITHIGYPCGISISSSDIVRTLRLTWVR